MQVIGKPDKRAKRNLNSREWLTRGRSSDFLDRALSGGKTQNPYCAETKKTNVMRRQRQPGGRRQ